MSEKARVARIAEIEGVAIPGQPVWRLVRMQLGIEAFGVNAWTATEAGQSVIAEHDELGTASGGHQELYVVLAGHATFTVDGEEIDGPAGTVVFVPDQGTRRSAVAHEAGTTVLVVGGKPGEPFHVAPWERNAAALRFWVTGDWERAIEDLSRLHEEEPESAGILYNLACAEARGGRAEDALRHLAVAIEREPSFRAHAQGDADLASLKDDPRFPADEPAA